MSIRQVQCPGCGTAANVPAAQANVKCPACGTVWNINHPGAANLSPAAQQQKAEPDSDRKESSASLAIVGALVGAGMFLLALVGLAVVLLSREPDPTAATETQVEDTIKPLEPEEYRVVNLPEATRKRIYNDYRKVARTTVEKPLLVPQGKVRKDLEAMLQGTFDRELMRFAALHDITVEDVKEVIKEGDAKQWDKSPRSNAVRDGKRVYAEEKSEGWKPNPNRK